LIATNVYALIIFDKRWLINHLKQLIYHIARQFTPPKKSS